ncbi:MULTISPECIES: hypothetical protein [unclassified Roseibium]|uniref:hypothetical protein n=1 Tax=unclassified Roseibium TaxID=2629323 RepID=UPI00273F1415|nr:MULTISPECIES: hypothetical protein [unclassified Roseibium]
MPARRLSEAVLQEALRLLEVHGSKRAAAAALGISRAAFQHRITRAQESKDSPETGPASEVPFVPAQLRKTGVFLLTAAQDETAIHAPLWENMQAYAAHRGAEILIGGFTYQKGLFEDHAVVTARYRPELIPFLQPRVIELGPNIVWYGAANILPTTSNPLAGWQTQTREKWAVFPHAKIALETVPVMPGRRPKQIMTSGVVTLPNYVQRNAGQKAEFHHTLGFTIVEVDGDGDHFGRQVSAEPDGSFQDLDVRVEGGQVSEGHRVKAINPPDMHGEHMPQERASLIWDLDLQTMTCGGKGLIDVLRPQYQFVDDSFTFSARNHHTRDDPHEKAWRIAEGNSSVQENIRAASWIMAAAQRPWCRTVHKASNHNLALDRWLKDAAGASDPGNAYYWHHLNSVWHEAIRRGDRDFQIHAYALQQEDPGLLARVKFLREGESFLICGQSGSPIECGLHSHVGARGSRSAQSLRRIVERVNAGHTHEAKIVDGLYFTGKGFDAADAFAQRGPGGWADALIVTYRSGKRSLVTPWNGKWRG